MEKYDRWTAGQIEKWRVCVFGSEAKILLLGHSTGAYMASAYCLYYPKKLDYLILCSAVCILTEKQYLKIRGLKEIDHEPYGFGSMFLSKYTWNYATWPDVVRALGWFGPYIFINALKETQKHHVFGDLDVNLSERMKDLWFTYTYHLHAQPKSYEDLLYAYMLPWCWPREPLLNRLSEKLECNLLLIYADDDMAFSDEYHGKVMLEKLKQKRNWKYKAHMEVIKGSSHQLFLNQPVDSCKAIIKYCTQLKIKK